MDDLARALEAAANPEDARVLARYFQVRPGGYGEGDVFIGIKLSVLRPLARPYVGAAVRAGALAGLVA